MPKSSIASSTPRSRSCCSTSRADVRVLHQGRLGDLDRDPGRRQLVPLEGGGDLAAQVVVELQRRDVDVRPRRRGRAEQVVPLGQLAAGLVEDEQAEAGDQAALLGERDERGRADRRRARGASSGPGTRRRPAWPSAVLKIGW